MRRTFFSLFFMWSRNPTKSLKSTLCQWRSLSMFWLRVVSYWREKLNSLSSWEMRRWTPHVSVKYKTTTSRLDSIQLECSRGLANVTPVWVNLHLYVWCYNWVFLATRRRVRNGAEANVCVCACLSSSSLQWRNVSPSATRGSWRLQIRRVGL